MMKNFTKLLAFLAFVSTTFAWHAAVKQAGSTTYCIIFDADAQGTVVYNDSLNQTQHYNFDINNITFVDGVCMGVKNKLTTETITLAFYPNDITPSIAADPWKLSIDFKENSEQTNNAYMIDSYNLTAIFYEEHFNASERIVTYVHDTTAEKEWHGEQNHGFKCSESGLTFVNGSSVSFKHLKVVAFGLLESDQFPKDQAFEECKLDLRTSDVVPIVVGACLAGLVIIVLIAYLIGRARAKRQGYASV